MSQANGNPGPTRGPSLDSASESAATNTTKPANHQANRGYFRMATLAAAQSMNIRLIMTIEW